MSTIQVSQPQTASSAILPEQFAFCEISNDLVSWSREPYLVPLRSSRTTGRTIGRASVRYDYGTIKREDLSAFEAWSPRDLVGQYIRIRVAEADRTWTAWTGVIADEVLSVLGTEDAPEGAQTFPAYELTHLMDRTPILQGRVLKDSTEITIDRLPAFNRPARRGLGLRGNRSDSTDSAGVYRFDAGGEVWSHLDILDYLIEYHAPEQFTVTLGGNYAALNEIRTAQALEGRTLYACINALVDRRRGFVWSLVIEDDTATIMIDTIFGEGVAMGGGATLPANARQREMIFDNAIDLADVRLSKLSGQRFDTVRVLGGPVISCCTFSFAAGTLEPAWTSAEETAYKNVSGSDNIEKDRERKSDKFTRVYQAFRVPDDWNGYGDNGKGHLPHPALPEVNDDGTLSYGTIADFWPEDKAFLRWIPVYEPDDDSDDTRERELMALLVICEDDDGTYHQIDSVESEDLTAAYVRTLDGELGVHLRPRINHILAGDDFDESGDGSDTAPEWDFEDLIVTAAFETDARLQVIAGSGDRELVVRVPEAQAWFVCPSTVTGVEDGDLAYFDQGEEGIEGHPLTRDDSDYLRALANLLLAWHDRERAELELTVRRLGLYADVGGYVTQAVSGSQADEVGTVVTSIDHDYAEISTTIRTGYAELNALSLPYEPGESDPQTVAGELKAVRAELQQERAHTARVDVRAPRLPFSSSAKTTLTVVGANVTNNVGPQTTLGYYETGWGPIATPFEYTYAPDYRETEDFILFGSVRAFVYNKGTYAEHVTITLYVDLANDSLDKGVRFDIPIQTYAQYVTQNYYAALYTDAYAHVWGVPGSIPGWDALPNILGETETFTFEKARIRVETNTGKQRLIITESNFLMKHTDSISLNWHA